MRPDAPADKLEPEAAEVGRLFNLPPEKCSIISIAISLKRIADAIEMATDNRFDDPAIRTSEADK